MLNISDRRSIETRSRMLLEKHCPEILRDFSATPIERLAEMLGLDIEYQYLTKCGEGVLGKLICTDGLTPYYDMDEQQYAEMSTSQQWQSVSMYQDKLCR